MRAKYHRSLAACVPEIGMMHSKLSRRKRSSLRSNKTFTSAERIRPQSAANSPSLWVAKLAATYRFNSCAQWQQHRKGSPAVSPKALSVAAGGQPAITRNKSMTNSAIAMSLNSAACGRFGQNWFAAQNRNAAASRIAFTNSSGAGRCANS